MPTASTEAVLCNKTVHDGLYDGLYVNNSLKRMEQTIVWIVAKHVIDTLFQLLHRLLKQTSPKEVCGRKHATICNPQCMLKFLMNTLTWSKCPRLCY